LTKFPILSSLFFFVFSFFFLFFHIFFSTDNSTNSQRLSSNNFESFSLHCCPIKIWPICCPETSVNNYKSTSHNIPEGKAYWKKLPNGLNNQQELSWQFSFEETWYFFSHVIRLDSYFTFVALWSFAIRSHRLFSTWFTKKIQQDARVYQNFFHICIKLNILYLTASSNHTSNNPPRMQNQRLLV